MANGLPRKRRARLDVFHIPRLGGKQERWVENVLWRNTFTSRNDWLYCAAPTPASGSIGNGSLEALLSCLFH
jgi:hypothetical protein